MKNEEIIGEVTKEFFYILKIKLIINCIIYLVSENMHYFRLNRKKWILTVRMTVKMRERIE